jgi:osmotically-inducible protein OsmY
MEADNTNMEGAIMRTLGRFIGILLGVVLLIMVGVLFERNRTELGGESVGQKIDRSLARTSDTVAESGDRVAKAAKERADRAREVTTQAGNDVRDRASANIERGAEKIGAAQAAVQQRIDNTSDRISDTAITASIKADILKDPTLSTRRMEVLTRQGEVTLTGSVESDVARERAGRMAATVAGVTRVDNQLAVAAR